MKLERSPKKNETKREAEADVNSCGSFFTNIAKLLGKKTARVIVWCIVAGNQLIIRGNDPKATQVLVEMLTVCRPMHASSHIPFSSSLIANLPSFCSSFQYWMRPHQQLVPLPCVMLVPLSDQYVPGYECNFIGLVQTSRIKGIDFNSSILLDVEFDIRTEGGSFSLEDFSKRGGVGGSIEDGINLLELEEEEEDVQHIHVCMIIREYVIYYHV
jgi:hypothetical protein